MSIEQAQAFIEKVKNDEDLQKRLNEAEDSEFSTGFLHANPAGRI